MSSLITGYEYDIFISYRQKDNKGDRWVSEFVEALKTELESTFKEEISVYFDINPLDGLLETHDVDESLKDKLKCLIFIPIISRTYCDPKSFAWEHEFITFVEQASKDQFGLKIKLPNGNVANRVLPVRIHDLDAFDIKEYESVIGGVLRGIEFIYKSAGVNRPLRAIEDHPQDNTNKTYYRDQINKVANAVNEIIDAIKKHDQPLERYLKPDTNHKSGYKKKPKTKIIAGFFILLTLISVGYFFIPKLNNPSEQLEKSIAVLPFKLLSDEPDKQYLADGMMDAITLHLSKIKDLKVMSRTSVEQYRGTTKTTRQIGKELDVVYLLEGSFQKVGEDAKLIVQLIKAGEESHAWANEYNRKWKDFFSVQSEVAKTIAKELHASISPDEKALVEKIPTTDLVAYDLYIKALNYDKKYESTRNLEYYNKASAFYKVALELDSGFAKAYTGLANIYYNRYKWETILKENYLDTCLTLVNKAFSFDNQLEDAYYLRGLYFTAKTNNKSALDDFNRAIQINPNYSPAYQGKGGLLTWKLYDFIAGIDNYNKALTLISGEERAVLLNLLGRAFLDVGFVEKARSKYKESFLISGDEAGYYNLLSWLEFSNENYEEALKLAKKSNELDSSNAIDMVVYMFPPGHEKDAYLHAKKLISLNKQNQSSTMTQNHRIGYAFYKAGKVKEAEQYFKQQIKESEEIIKLGRIMGYNFQAQSILAQTYAFLGEKEKAYENLEVLSKNTFFPLWQLSILKNDPLYISIRGEDRFQTILKKIELKHLTEHERVEKWLEEKGML